MKVKYIVIILAVVAAAIACWQVVSRTGAEEDDSDTGPRRPLLTQKNARVSAVKPLTPAKTGSAAATTKGKKKRDPAAKRRLALRFPGLDPSLKWDGIYRDEDGNEYPPEEQEIMKKAEAAIDNDDLESARELSEIAVNSKNKELRESVVDALGWFGKNAMAELTPYLSDPDAEIADSAKSQWMDALQELEDDGEIAGVVESALKSLRDKDMIEEVADELTCIDELAAIQVLVDVIEGGASQTAKDVSKEVYNSITDEDWSGVDAAENWLQENYEPPDADD